MNLSASRLNHQLNKYVSYYARPWSNLCWCILFFLDKWHILFFTYLQYVGKSLAENSTGQYRCSSDNPNVSHISPVSLTAEIKLSTTFFSWKTKHSNNVYRSKKNKASKFEDGLCSIVCKLIKDRGNLRGTCQCS